MTSERIKFIEELDNRFKYHAPKQDKNQTGRYREIRDEAKSLALLIEDCCPASRERSIAFTRLEACVMWANASIARNE